MTPADKRRPHGTEVTYEWEVTYTGGGFVADWGEDEAGAREMAAPIGRLLRRRRVIREPWEVVIDHWQRDGRE